jgi:hypothetical protein
MKKPIKDKFVWLIFKHCFFFGYIFALPKTLNCKAHCHDEQPIHSDLTLLDESAATTIPKLQGREPGWKLPSSKKLNSFDIKMRIKGV